MRQPRNRAGLPGPLVWLGLGVLAAIVGVLVFAALQQGDVDAVPTRPAPPVSVTPTEPATTAAAPQALPELSPSLARLSALGDASLWRATAAICAADVPEIPPVIERSGDGQTWEDVTPPANTDVRQVLWLQAINDSSAEAVVLVGPACDTQVLRTFTSGNFWEPYPNSITGAAIVDASADVVRTAGAELPLPCAAPTVAVSGAAANTPTVLCSGQVATWAGDAWQALELANIVAASVVVSDGTLVTAREVTSDCDGVLVERWAAGAPQNQRCVPGNGVLAVQATADGVWIWSTSELKRVTWES